MKSKDLNTMVAVIVIIVVIVTIYLVYTDRQKNKVLRERIAELQKKKIEGTITPTELTELEQKLTQQQKGKTGDIGRHVFLNGAQQVASIYKMNAGAEEKKENFAALAWPGLSNHTDLGIVFDQDDEYLYTKHTNDYHQVSYYRVYPSQVI